MNKEEIEVIEFLKAVIDILFILVLMVQCYNLGKIVQLQQVMEYQYKVVEEKVR